MRALKVLDTVAKCRRHQVPLPRFLTYIVTFTCNARCIMCDSWKKPSKDALSTDEIDRIFAQLPQLDVVRLSGGEPFVRPDLGELCALAQRHLAPALLHITTNGFLTDEILALCETRDRSVPLQLLVSVDGVGEKHNQVRGRRTAWESVMATLQALAPRQREFNLRLGVNQTIVDAEGLEHYRMLRELLHPLGVRNNIVMAYDASATYSLVRDTISQGQIGQFTTFGEFTEDQLEALFAEVENDWKSLPLLERIGKRYYMRGIRNRLLHGRAAPKPSCVALHAHMRLMPNGDVPVCQFNSRPVGNLRHQRFDEVWYAKVTDESRRWVQRCPGCWAECEVLPSAVYTGDIVRGALPARSESRR